VEPAAESSALTTTKVHVGGRDEGKVNGKDSDT